MKKTARSASAAEPKRRAAQTDSVGPLSAAQAGRLVAAASDVALVLDGDGVIQDVTLGDETLAREHVESWIGRAWADTVTVESREKVEALLRDAAGAAGARWRQVNHPSRGGSDWPVLYSAVRLEPAARGTAGRTIAFGRDLRANEALQLRLLEAQQAMERDYWRFRQAEARYRHLFQSSAEAVLIVEAGSLKVLEANPAAIALVSNGSGVRKLAGTTLAAIFENPAAKPLQAALTAARAARKAEPARVDLAGGAGRVNVAISSFRQDDASLLLVRLSRLGAEPAAAQNAQQAASLLGEFVASAPDALVFTDPEGRIVLANPAFLALAQLGNEEQARGQRLDRWLGRTGVELGVLIQNLRQRGSVRLFATLLRGEDGGTAEVEISASVAAHGAHTMLAFAVRDIGRRLSAEPRAAGELPRSAGELTELVGRVPLKDIVGETTDLIEQLCIETALKMTSDNRASAAQMLGLSRQSLYVKLRRHGLGDIGDE